MRRIATALAVCAVLAGGWVLLSGTGGTSGGYRVDAIFDNAGFLIPGQDVKIAGARVGEVVDVTLTADRRARVKMAIDPAFAPIRSDADCTIQPQSLIGEKFIQCTPGTPRGTALRPRGGHPPTIPVTRTHSPVDIDLVLATLDRPVTERVALIVNELGAGLAARGDDLNASIRRANPALQEVNRVLRIADRDRHRLRAIVRASDRILGRLAHRRDRVARIVDDGAAVVTETARRADAIEQAVARLPGLLDEARPALRDLRALATSATPVLGDLQSAAPQVRRLARDLGPLAEAARPALDRLGTASRTGAGALRSATPVVRLLRRNARVLRPVATMADELLRSLRERGVPEGLQDFAYYAALATSRFDRHSHMIPAHLLGSDCSEYATVTVEHCSAQFVASQATKARRRAAARALARKPAPRPRRAEATEPATPEPSRPAQGERPRLPLLDQLTDRLPVPPPVRDALDGVLGDGGDDAQLGGLLDYLLGR